MEIYTTDINNAVIRKIPNIIRDGKTAQKLANFVLKLQQKTTRYNTRVKLRMYIL